MIADLLQITLPDGSVYNEFASDGGAPRPYRAHLIESLQAIGSEELARRWERAERDGHFEYLESYPVGHCFEQHVTIGQCQLRSYPVHAAAAADPVFDQLSFLMLAGVLPPGNVAQQISYVPEREE